MATQMILLTATEKNGVAYTGPIAIDTSDITVPITAVSATVSLVTVRKDWDNNHISDKVNVDVWTVTHSLAAIAAMDTNLLVVAVTKRKSAARERVYATPENQVFYLPSIVGPVEPDAAGAKFLFHEQGDPCPVQYFTNISPAAFIASVTSGITGNLTTTYIPYATSPTTLGDSWLQRTAGSIMIQTGKVLATSTPGQTEIAFGVGGDEFDVSTNGSFNTESRVYLTPTSFSIQGGGAANYIAGSTAGLTLASDALLSITSPVTTFQASALIQSFNNLATIDFSATGDAFIFTTDNQAGTEGYLEVSPAQVNMYLLNGVNSGGLAISSTGSSTLDASAQVVISAPSVQIGTPGAGNIVEIESLLRLVASDATDGASLNIPAGVDPTAPVNGDVWFDGTNYKGRIGGVTVTFTTV